MKLRFLRKRRDLKDIRTHYKKRALWFMDVENGLTQEENLELKMALNMACISTRPGILRSIMANASERLELDKRKEEIAQQRVLPIVKKIVPERLHHVATAQLYLLL